ncbi:hypothetical protein [Paenibacillus sp. SYP-B4298]|uniref:hypothetical protein n=1 Tax=Paenibacillus sp. SYP-B4298 TaxID=2996034 RepID=UPI0022DE6AB6|nr:hypothetical protein [Paenibacillus sp. SYP-B4298]
MTNVTTNGDAEIKEEGMSQEQWVELIKALYHNGLTALKTRFDDVEGQVMNFQAYGPVFVFHVKDDEGSTYSCGFFLRELIARFQSGNDPAMWMSSFYVDLMETKGGRALQQPATNEEEAKAIVDKILVPQCVQAVKEEFPSEQVHAGLDWNKEIGPVFETGFPAIKDGNNVCAFPLHLLLTYLQLNRDPSEVLVQGLYEIRRQHGLED